MAKFYFKSLLYLILIYSSLLQAQSSETTVLKKRIEELEEQLVQEKRKNDALKQEQAQFQEVIHGLQQTLFAPDLFLEPTEILLEVVRAKYQAQEISEFEWVLSEAFLEQAKWLQEEKNEYEAFYKRLMALATKRYNKSQKKLKTFFKACGLLERKTKKSSFRVPIKKEWLEGDQERREELKEFEQNATPPELKLSHWLNSEALNVDHLKGKVVLLNFWAPW